MPKRVQRIWIGIDIGKEGAIVVQNAIGPIETYTTPLIGGHLDFQALYRILQKYKSAEYRPTVVFEDLHAIFNSSAKSTFTFGGISYATEAFCVALEIPHIKVTAKVWQKELFVGIPEMRKKAKPDAKKKPGLDTKPMALLAAKRLFPNFNLLATPRSSVPHNGIVDALLISEYAKRHY